jgi:O-antigen ligase
MRLLAFALFLVGLLLTGVLGTETRLLLFWPGCSIIGLAGLVAGLRWNMRIHFAPHDACLGAVLLLTLYLLGRCAMSPVMAFAREDAVLILAGLIAYLLTCTVASHPRWRIGIMVVLVILTAGNFMLGLEQFKGNWGAHILPNFVRNFDPSMTRIGGFYNNANHLSAFLSFVILLSLGLTCFGRGGASAKLVLGFVGMCAAICMAKTESRGGLIGLCVGVAVVAVLGLWVMWKTQRHIFGRLLAGVLVLFVLSGGVLALVNAEFLRNRAAVGLNTGEVRWHLWDMALQQNALQPLVGAGSRMFYDYCMILRPHAMPAHEGDAQFVHNEYLQVLADYGWVGLGLVALVLVLHLAHGWRFVRWFANEKFPHVASLESNTLGFTVGALAAAAATLTHAIFEFQFHVASIVVVMAIIMGFLANPGFDLEVSRSQYRLPFVRLLSKVMLILGSAGLVAAAYQWGPGDWFAARAGMAEHRGDMQERMHWLDDAIESDPMNPDSWHNRGIAWMEQWKPEYPEAVRKRLTQRAVDDLKQASLLDSYNFLYATALTDALDANGERVAAFEAATRAVTLAPEHEEARLAMALHHHRWGDFAEAERCYLWAQIAGTPNRAGETLWIDGYRQLMKDRWAKR